MDFTDQYNIHYISMWRLNQKILPILTIHFSLHILVFMAGSWIVFSLLMSWDPVNTVAAGFLGAVIALCIEWIIASYLAISFLDPKWVKESEDTVLWSIIHGVEIETHLKIRKIGIIDSEATNAIIISSLIGSPTLVITNSLLKNFTSLEVRAVIFYALSASSSGFLGIATFYSGLLSIAYKLSEGVVEEHLEGGIITGYKKLLAGLGYLLYALIVEQSENMCYYMMTLSDDLALRRSKDPASYLCAFLKSVDGTVRNSKRNVRKKFTPLKGLMFIDPTRAFLEYEAVFTAAKSIGINTGKLFERDTHFLMEQSESELHAFERYKPHRNLVERFRKFIGIGKEIKASIKIGLTWIE
jgi:hypothetical protein